MFWSYLSACRLLWHTALSNHDCHCDCGQKARFTRISRALSNVHKSLMHSFRMPNVSAHRLCASELDHVAAVEHQRRDAAASSSCQYYWSVRSKPAHSTSASLNSKRVLARAQAHAVEAHGSSEAGAASQHILAGAGTFSAAPSVELSSSRNASLPCKRALDFAAAGAVPMGARSGLAESCGSWSGPSAGAALRQLYLDLCYCSIGDCW